ncbi:hypothetical protein L596_016822 [Steinernema carpocapsae]|uniref:Uncharacterized protein n=1 Tax=Steinernema carpocapsae TaxID=34508 RepID=A0A4V6A3H9_STECR|nr:hypothetical protein L596_016822 [Steinernema carpocapsae]
MEGKVAFLKAVQREKEILFGGFTSTITAKLKEQTCFAIPHGRTIEEPPWKSAIGPRYPARMVESATVRLIILFWQFWTRRARSSTGNISETWEPENDENLKPSAKQVETPRRFKEAKRSAARKEEEKFEGKKRRFQMQLLNLQLIQKEIGVFGRQLTPYEHINAEGRDENLFIKYKQPDDDEVFESMGENFC